MARAIRRRTVVLPGHRIEVEDPGLTVGQAVDVTVVADDGQEPPLRKISFAEFLATRPPREPLFKTAEEVDQYIQAERDSWD